jgi:hypothetical protein
VPSGVRRDRSLTSPGRSRRARRRDGRLDVGRVHGVRLHARRGEGRDAERLGQLRLGAVVRADQLDVLRAARAVDGQRDERVGGAGRVGAAGCGDDAGALGEPVHERPGRGRR